MKTNNLPAPKISNAMRFLLSALKPATYEDGKTPKGRTSDKKEIKKTQPGAVHKHNPTFRSRRILDVTPAQYRRMHMGSKR